MPDRATTASAKWWCPTPRRAVASATIVLVVIVTAGASSTAAGASSGPCPEVDGVTVVVDFGALGGGVQVRCAPGDPDNGYAALSDAGFAVDGTLRSPSFLCRIDGQPTAATDPCVVPSPPWAYWSYWIADRGGAWCYSDTGMYGRNPPRGTVEGWAFVSGSNPGSIRAPRSSTFSRLAGAGTTGVDCDDATTATTVPVTTAPQPPTTRPPVGHQSSPRGADPGARTTVPGVPAGAPAAPNAPPQSGSTGAPAGDAGSPGTTEGAEDPEASTIPGSQSTTTTTAIGGSGDGKVLPVAGSEPGEADPAAGSDAEVDRDGGSEEQASTVALDHSGRGGPGSALATGLGAGMIAAVGAAAVVVNRRRLQPPDGV